MILANRKAVNLKLSKRKMTTSLELKEVGKYLSAHCFFVCMLHSLFVATHPLEASHHLRAAARRSALRERLQRLRKARRRAEAQGIRVEHDYVGCSPEEDNMDYAVRHAPTEVSLWGAPLINVPRTVN